MKDTYSYGLIELDNIIRGKEEKNTRLFNRAYKTTNALKTFKCAFSKLLNKKISFN